MKKMLAVVLGLTIFLAGRSFEGKAEVCSKCDSSSKLGSTILKCTYSCRFESSQGDLLLDYGNIDSAAQADHFLSLGGAK